MKLYKNFKKGEYVSVEVKSKIMCITTDNAKATYIDNVTSLKPSFTFNIYFSIILLVIVLINLRKRFYE